MLAATNPSDGMVMFQRSWLWWGFTWLLWILLIVVIVLAVKALWSGNRDGRSTANSPLEVLQDGFARGETGKAEHDRKRKV